MPSVVPQAKSLGSKRLFEILIRDVFADGGRHRADDVCAYCLARQYRVGAQLGGALELLVNVGVLQSDGESLQPGAKFPHVAEANDVSLALSTLLVGSLAGSSEIESVFPPESLSWGDDNGGLNLHLSKVPISGFPLVKLFRDLGMVLDSADATALLKIQQPFSELLLSALSTTTGRHRTTRMFSPERLAILQQAQADQGARGEAFAFAWEQERLRNHPRLTLVQRISLMNTAAGYDIESFEGPKSVLLDRFIEVKSYKGAERFFLSLGEMEAARELADSYYLYLVDMDRLGSSGYSPIVIRNPVSELYDSESYWSVSPVNFEICRKLF